MSSMGGQIMAFVMLFIVLWANSVRAAILKPSIQDCLKNLPPLASLSLDMNQLVSIIPAAEESCQCVGRAGGAITEVFAALFTQKLGMQLPECLMKAVRESDPEAAVGSGSTYSFLENIVTSVVSEITNDLLFGRDETRGAHDMGSL